MHSLDQAFSLSDSNPPITLLSVAAKFSSIFPPIIKPSLFKTSPGPSCSYASPKVSPEQRLCWALLLFCKSFAGLQIALSLFWSRLLPLCMLRSTFNKLSAKRVSGPCQVLEKGSPTLVRRSFTNKLTEP